MTIQIEVRNVYGNETIYPANETAKTFAAIAGTKTLKSETLKLAKSLGYKVELVQNAAEALTMERFAS
jgi:hypothetical protein